ncbi:MAG TPA: 30S ribosome-binding factor RbfA [Gammaproteobacteria bacterium]|nr:30S ribosome-binding factor RbfA [Gammaproteobacteria bacterium]
MAREFERSSRVAGQLQRELSELIRREVKDPRVRLVTVTKVDVTRDLSHAKVLISVLGEDGPQPEVLAALQHAAGFLRHQLGKMLKMRSIPELHFAQDEVLERAAQLTALINRANSGKGPGEGDA